MCVSTSPCISTCLTAPLAGDISAVMLSSTIPRGRSAGPSAQPEIEGFPGSWVQWRQQGWGKGWLDGHRALRPDAKGRETRTLFVGNVRRPVDAPLCALLAVMPADKKTCVPRTFLCPAEGMSPLAYTRKGNFFLGVGEVKSKPTTLLSALHLFVKQQHNPNSAKSVKTIKPFSSARVRSQADFQGLFKDAFHLRP